MSASSTITASEPRPAKPLSQLMPFNEHRFEACMAYIAAKYGRKLSQYDMVKLHVQADIHHTLMTGQPIIGGDLEPWKYGMLVRRAYYKVDHWRHQYDLAGEEPEMLQVVEQGGNVRRFAASVAPDEDDFSETEKRAMDKAWNDLKGILDDWRASQRYLHDRDASFIGRAWDDARRQRRHVDWNEIIDAYDEFHGTDHSHIKALIQL